MSLRTYTGNLSVFPSFPGVAAADFALTTSQALGGVRTQGASNVQPIQGVTPSKTQEWSLLGVTMIGYLVYVCQASPPPTFGQFGKIETAVMADQSSASGGLEYDVPMKPLPVSPLAQGDLWNPAVDPMPPVIALGAGIAVPPPSPSTSLAISTYLALAVPLKLTEVTSLFVGVWMNPSILAWATGVNQFATIGLEIFNLGYTLNLDDGS